MNTLMRAKAVLAALVAAGVVSACAEKELLTPARDLTRMVIQVSITSADQQVGFGPKYLVAAAGFDGEADTNDDDGGLLGYSVIPYTPGNHTLRVPVNLAPCLAYFARKGRGACQLLIGAAIVADTSFVTDTIGDPFATAFDFFFEGPFSIGASGTLPTVPPINLSASRFGVVQWAPDDPMRIGGISTPTNLNSAVTGAIGPGGSVTLFASTSGPAFAATGNQPPTGPYAQLAILEAGKWRRVSATTIPAQGAFAFTSVAAISTSEVYLGHNTGLYRYDGTGISRVSSVTDSIASVGTFVTPGGQKLVIAGTTSGAAWIGDGTTFTRRTLNTTQRIDGVCVTSNTEAFASSTSGGAYRFDGNNWTIASTPFTSAKLALQCPAPGQAFLISNGQPLLRWNGTSFTTMITTGLPPAAARPVVWGVVSPTEIYAVADSAGIDRAFYRFDGQTWTEIARTRFTQQTLPLAQLRLWADPRGGAAYYASSFSRIEKVTPSGVSLMSYQPGPRDLMMTSEKSAFAVGWNMFLARWDGTQWNMDAPPPRTPSVRILHGVWSDGPSNAWAVGNASTIYRWNGSAWSVFSENSSPISGSLDNYNAVWGSGSDVFIVGDQTILHCRGTSCSTEASGGTGTLYSIWGSSPTNMFAVGAGGRITRYNGTTWTAMPSPTTRHLARVRGSAPNNVWAVGDSVLIRFDGTSWINVPFVDDNRNNKTRVPSFTQSLFQVGLHVQGPNEVYVAGDAGITRWDGKEWRSMTDNFVQRRAIAISIAPGGCGFALSELASEQPGMSLQRGIGPTGCLSAPIPPVTKWP